jgi:osmoprotectant transport system permease protein
VQLPGVAGAADPWIRWDWVSDHTDEIWAATRQHVELTVIAVAIGLVISVPLGIVAHRRRRFRGPALTLTGLLYTIPSLALFAFLVPLYGLSRLTAEIGLVSYTLLIIVRNVITGLDGVPDEARDAATGMGMTGGQILRRVELPLAVPAIVAGVRIATVTTIGLVTVTAVIGQGGLGQLIQDGLQRDFKSPLVVGLAGSVALAFLADALLLLVERLLTPWTRKATV